MVNIKEYITIRKWLIILLLPLLIIIMGSMLNIAMVAGNIRSKVETNTEDIKIIEQIKANKDTQDRIFNALDRIETKLDQHIKDND